MFYEEVFRTLNDTNVRYLVAGNLAVNLHGVPRMTQDLDIQLHMDQGNITTAIEALRERGYESRLPVDPEQFAREETREQWIQRKDMKAFTMVHSDKDLRQVDFLFNLPINFEKLENNKVVKRADDVEIPLVSVDDLIRLKKQSNRKQDQSDVNMLRKMKEQKNGE